MREKKQKKQKSAKLKAEDIIAKMTSKRDSKQEMLDVERAKQQAAKIREQGLVKYKQKLLAELESDKKRKLQVVNCLFVFTLLVVATIYYAQTLNPERLTNALNELINEML